MTHAKKNITELKDCYGCGVCVVACPVGIIAVKENLDGFYSPVIDNPDKCIECGICLDICAFNQKEVCTQSDGVQSYSGWSNDPIVRQRCSSGGVGFEIGKKLIEQGYSACAVRYNPATNRAEHFIAHSVEDFMPSIGSKYIPSFTADAFDGIDRKSSNLVVGTPCQIDSFRRYIRRYKAEDNFFLLDFFCHGVPSLLVWDKYTDELQAKIGKITFASWRNKTTGWHDSWAVSADTDSDAVDWHSSYNLKIKGKKHFYFSRLTQGDLFYRYFLGNYCLNHCCYRACKYKMCSSAADIRIGDLWGTKYANDTKGVNAVIAFTPRGKELLDTLSRESRCTIVHETVSTTTDGQMPHSPAMPWVRQIILKRLHTCETLAQIDKTWLRAYRISTIPKRAINKIFRILNLKPIFH